MQRSIFESFRIGSLLSFILFGLCLCSCTNEELNVDSTGFSKGKDTYFRLALQVGGEPQSPSDGFQPTKATQHEGDTLGTAAENAIKNAFVLFFDEDKVYESNIYLPESMLTQENGSGNLGSSASEGFTFTKAIETTSGKKYVYAVVNPSPYIMTYLYSVLNIGTTTVSDLKSMEIDFLPAGVTYPSRVDLPKYGNYVAPTPNGLINVDRLGIDGVNPSSTNGMLMLGDNEVELDPGVSESQATHGNQNIVTIYVDRLAAKVSAKLNYPPIYTGWYSDRYWETNNPEFGIYYFEWWLGNMPSKCYFTEHKTGQRHPYYYQGSDFSMWQNAAPTAKALLTNDYGWDYLPENVVEKPKSGNVSYFALRGQIANRGTTANGGRIYTSPGGSQRITMPFTNVDVNSYYYNGLWIINQEGSTTPHYIIPSRYIYAADEQVKALHDNYKWWLFFPETTGNPDVFLINMTTVDKSKATQDAAALALSGGTTIAPGYYMFYYSCKALHTNEWFDRMQVWEYTGTSTEDGWVRQNEQISTLAYYKNFYCYYRVNLEDVTKAVGTSDRYAVNRNDWFQLNIDSINDIGFPDEEDINNFPDDELGKTWLEVSIKVQDWRNGGTQNVVIEND